LLEAETNKYCPGGNDIGAISNLITWVLNFFLSVGVQVVKNLFAEVPGYQGSEHPRGSVVLEVQITHQLSA
jgi:hypothetical protein